MFSRYYRFAGQPMHFAAEWHGLPPAAVRRGSRELGALGMANFYESSAPAYRRYPPLVTAYRQHGQRSLFDPLSGPPMRPSGPEPLDPGEMAEWQGAYREDRMAQPVGASEAEITMEPMYVGPAKPAPSFLGLSTNEKRLALVAGVAAVGYYFWRRRKK